jgi:hypothetical protein
VNEGQAAGMTLAAWPNKSVRGLPGILKQDSYMF